jgi:hypothetical protein
MAQVVVLVDRLAPDTINRLERAAGLRFDDAVELFLRKRYLGSVYLFGHCVEMCIAAAFFRSAGFAPNAPIDRETRLRHMKRGRQLTTVAGAPLMNSDPHPLVGWARFLQWQRLASKPTKNERERLEEAIKMAEVVYRSWRPELRYKTIDFPSKQVDQVHQASAWFIANRDML